MYEVRLANQAASYVRRLDTPSQKRILARLRQIANDPYGANTKLLTGAEKQRASRVGGWRIVYSVDETERVVRVSDIAPRGEIYRRL